MTCYCCGGDMAETTTTYFEQLEKTLTEIAVVNYSAA